MIVKRIISILSIKVFLLLALTASSVSAASCGEAFQSNSAEDANSKCNCVASNNTAQSYGVGPNQAHYYCCGYAHVSSDGIKRCNSYEDENQYACGETNGSKTIPEGASCNCEGGSWQSYLVWNFIWQDRNVCCGWVNNNTCYPADPTARNVFCGDTYQTSLDSNSETAMACVCGSGGGKVPMDNGTTCCGWLREGKCEKTDGALIASASAETLNSLNPLAVGNGNMDLSTPGGIITRALGSFVFPIAGIILFVQLVLGGFQMLAGATNSKSIDDGKQKITAAIIGFLILFAAYWIAQLLEIIFGIRILS